MFETIAAKFVATRIGASLARVPRWAWIALAVTLLLVAGAIWHHHKAQAAIDRAVAAAVTARDAQWQKRLEQAHADALAWKGKAEASARTISDLKRKQHDEDLRRIADDAGDLRLRGPGAAAAPGCRPGDHPGLPAAAGGPHQPDRAASAAPGALPSTDRVPGLPAAAADRLALVPWGWLVDVGQGSDDARAEVLTWRSWYAEQFAAWERMRSTAAGAAKAKKGNNDGR
jgi:hypothetical protein